MKLKELIKIESGVNTVRLKDNEYELYTLEDVNYDLGHGEDYKHEVSYRKNIVARGDIVTNTVGNMNSIVHTKNSGKLLNQIFMKLSINNKEILDPWYLCYLLNESEYIKYQEASIMDGSVIKKLTKVNLENLEVNLPTIDEQRKIGEAYKETLRKYTLITEKAELEKNLYLQMLGEKDLNNRSVVENG